MADVNATFVYDADFTSAVSQTRILSRELSVLNNSFNSLDKNSRKVRDRFAEVFKADVGNLGAFSARTVDITSNMDNFGKSLDRNKLKLRDYAREARKAFQADSNSRKLAEDQVRRSRASLVEMGMDASGRRKGILVTPLSLDMSDFDTKLEVSRKQFSIFNRLINDGATQLINWGKNTQWAGRQLTVGLTVPMTIFATTTIKAFNDVDKELTRFQKVYGSDLVGSTKEATNAIRQQVQALAVDIAGAYGVAAKETAGLAADLAATGLEGQKLLDSIKQTTRLSVLGEIDRQDAMKTTLSLQNAFNMSTQELSESINFLNAVENQTSLSLQDLTEAIPKVGPVVRALGGDVKDLSVLMVAMKEGGINAAEGANALKSGLASLINPTKAGSEVAKQYGIDLEDIVKRNKGQLLPTVLEFQKSMQTLDDLGKAKIIEQLFGKYQFARISALFDNLNTQGSQTKQVIELMSASNSDLAKIANDEIKVLTESASMRFKRSMEAIKAALLPVGEAIVNSVLPFMEKFAGVLDKIVSFAQNLPGPIKSFLKVAGGFTAIAGPLIMMTGVLGNFLGYLVKGSMAFVNLGRRIRGLPTEKFALMDDAQIAAAKATDMVTLSVQKQKDAMVGLNKLMMDYYLLINKQAARTPNLFNSTPLTTTIGGSPVVPKGTKTLPIIRRQSGGPAYVPGSGSGDKIPALLEPGEFVINREATKQYGGLLEDINNGVPRFARGGGLKFGSEKIWEERQRKLGIDPDSIAYSNITYRRQFQARQADEQVSTIIKNAKSKKSLIEAIPKLVESVQSRTGIRIREVGETKPFAAASTFAMPAPVNALYNDFLPGKKSNPKAFIYALTRIANAGSNELSLQQKKSLFNLVSNGDAPGDPKLIGFMSKVFNEILEKGMMSQSSQNVAAKMAIAASLPEDFIPLRMSKELGNIVAQSKGRSIAEITENKSAWKKASEKLGLDSFSKDAQSESRKAAVILLSETMGISLRASSRLIKSQRFGKFQVSHAQTGGILRAQNGAWVPGSGSGDRVPALLEPGEFVINRNAAKQYGGVLEDINNGTPRFQSGGRMPRKIPVPGYMSGLTDMNAIDVPPRNRIEDLLAQNGILGNAPARQSASNHAWGLTLERSGSSVSRSGLDLSHIATGKDITDQLRMLGINIPSGLLSVSEGYHGSAIFGPAFLNRIVAQMVASAATGGGAFTEDAVARINTNYGGFGEGSEFRRVLESGLPITEREIEIFRNGITGLKNQEVTARNALIELDHFAVNPKNMMIEGIPNNSPYKNELASIINGSDNAVSLRSALASFTAKEIAEGRLRGFALPEGSSSNVRPTEEQPNAGLKTLAKRNPLSPRLTPYLIRRQSGGPIRASRGITGPKPFSGVPTVKVNPFKLIGMGGVNEDNPIAGLDEKSGMFYKQIKNNRGFNKDAMISEAVFSQIYKSGLFGENVTGIDQRLFNADTGNGTMPVLGSKFIESLRTGDDLFDGKPRKINKPSSFDKAIVDQKAVEAMLASKILGNYDTHTGNFGISNGKFVMLDNTSNLLTDANGLQRRTSQALNDFSYSPDRDALDRLGTQAYRKNSGSEKATIKYLDSILDKLNDGQSYVSQAIMRATQGSPELLKSMNDYAFKKSRGASKTYEELVTSMIALRVEKMKSNLYVDEDNLTLADGGPRLALQSGGMIKAMRGINMPESYATKLGTIRQSMANANKEAMSSDIPLTELGTRQSRIGGFSSAIPGVNGIYEINGNRYVVKGHDTYESAKAEADMARITRDVFGLQSPNQEVVRIKHPETGDFMFAVRSPYNEIFTKTTGRFTEDSAFDQLIASVARRDKDLQADNLFDDIVTDVGQAGIMSKASQPRIKTGPTNSALEQLAINLGMTKSGARSHGAEAWNAATANMTDAQIISRIKEAAAKAKARFSTADIPEDFKYIGKDLDDIASADLGPFVAHLRTVFPKEKKPLTEAAIAKKEQQKLLDRQERQSALDAGYPAWAMQGGGIIKAQRGITKMPGVGSGLPYESIFAVGKKAEPFIGPLPQISYGIQGTYKPGGYTSMFEYPFSSRASAESFQATDPRKYAGSGSRITREINDPQQQAYADWIAGHNSNQFRSNTGVMRILGMEGHREQMLKSMSPISQSIPLYRGTVLREKGADEFSGAGARSLLMYIKHGMFEKAIGKKIQWSDMQSFSSNPNIASYGKYIESWTNPSNTNSKKAADRKLQSMEMLPVIFRLASSQGQNGFNISDKAMVQEVMGRTVNEKEWVLNNPSGTISGISQDIKTKNYIIDLMQSGGIFHAQDGAWVPGSGEGDRVPALLEPGEFVVNKKAAAQNSDLLNDINFNQAPRFQSGGVIPELKLGGRFAKIKPSLLPKSEYQKLTDSAYKRKNVKMSEEGDMAPTYEINGSSFVFQGRGDDFSGLASRGITVVGTTPQDLLKQAIALNPKDRSLKRMLKNIEDKTFGRAELKLLDQIAASISINRRGRESGVENVDGFAMVLSSLAGNESAKKLVSERTKNFYKVMSANQARETQRTTKRKGFSGEIDTADIPAFHATNYPVVRDADGNINIFSMGHHSMNTSASVPRASIHTTLEAPVVGHVARQNTESQNLIVSRLSSLIEDNGVPIHINPTDTFFMRNPGQPLKMSEASVVRNFESRQEYDRELKTRGIPTGTSSSPIIAVDPKTKDILFLRKKEYSEDDRTELSKMSEQLELLMIRAKNQDGQSQQIDTRNPMSLIGFEDDILQTLSVQLAKKQLGINSSPASLEQHGLTSQELNERVFNLAAKHGKTTRPHSQSGPERLEDAGNQRKIKNYTKTDFGAGIEGVRQSVASGAFGSTKIEQRGPMFGAGVQTGGIIRAQDGAWVPGSGEGDRVPALLEPGEFVVNKKAAKQYGGLLQDINWNLAPRFMEGTPRSEGVYPSGSKNKSTNPSSIQMSDQMGGRMPGQMPGMAAGAVSGGLMAASMASSMMLPVNKFTDALNKSIMALSAFTGILSAMQMLGVNMGGGFGKKMSGATMPKAGSKASIRFDKGAGKVAEGKAGMAMSGVGNKLKGAKTFSVGKTLMGIGRTAALMTNPVGWAIAATMAVTTAVMAYKKALDSAKKSAQQMFGASKAEAEAFGVELRSVSDAIKSNREYTKSIDAQAQQSQFSTPGRLDPEKEALVLGENKDLTKRLRNLGETRLNTTGIPFVGDDRSGERDLILTAKYASLLQEGFSEEDANIMVRTLAKASGAMDSYYNSQKQFRSIKANNGGSIVTAQMEALDTFKLKGFGGGEGAFSAGIKEIVSNINLLPPEQQYEGLKALLTQIETLDTSKLKNAQQSLVDLAQQNYGEDSQLALTLAAIQDKTDDTFSWRNPTSWDQISAPNSQEESTALSAALTSAFETGVITEDQLKQYQIDIDTDPDSIDEIQQEIDGLLKARDLKIKVDLDYKKSLDEQLEKNNKKIILEQQRMQDALDAKDKSIEKEQDAFKASQKASQKFIKDKQKELKIIDEKATKEIEAIEKQTETYLKSLTKQDDANKFIAEQRGTMLGGLGALAEGDIFGFLDAQMASEENARQFSISEEIKAIEEKTKAATDAIDLERDQRVEAIQSEIDKRQEAFEKEAEGHEAKIDQLQKERQEMTTNFSKTISEMQSLSDGIAAIRGNDKILAWLNTINDPFAKAAQQAAVINHLINNPAATVDEAFRDVQARYNQSNPAKGGSGTSTTGTGKESPSTYASGGFVSGPGTGTSDSVPARLSDGEYVVKASAVDQYGVGMMDSINEQRFADGGQVLDDYSRVTYGGKTFNARTVRMLKKAEKTYGSGFQFYQGSYNTGVAASMGTHDGGGAVDIKTPANINNALSALVSAGFYAKWRGSMNPPHIHALARGDAQLSPAARRQLGLSADGGYQGDQVEVGTRTREDAINMVAAAGQGTVKELTDIMNMGAAAVYKPFTGRKFGGSMTMNKPYIVGENGPEVVVPYGSGSRVDPKFNVPENSSITTVSQTSGGIINNNSSGNMVVNLSVNGVNDPNKAANRVIEILNSEAKRRNHSRKMGR